ncbi:MAG TPA: PIN domain-containing protein [Burkholderiaceae bacterium]|nr:PIN domain-containing protein [Burkholderiaceae bacterium]
MTVTYILVDYENTQPTAQEVALLHDADQRLWIFRGPSQKKYDAEFAEALLPLAGRVRVVRCEKSGRNALDMHIAFEMGRLLGELAGQAGGSPAFAFTVVSRDTDYEPLLQYIRTQGYAANRVTSIREALGASPAEQAGVAKGGRSGAGSRATAAEAHAPPARKKPTRKTPAAKAVKKSPKAAVTKSAAKAAGTTGATDAAESIDALVDKAVDRLRDYPKQRPTRRDRLESWLSSHLRSRLAGRDVQPVIAALEQRGVVRFSANKIEYPAWA